VRNSATRIIPYLMEAERRDIRNGKFVINGRIYELDWLLKKMQWNEKQKQCVHPCRAKDALFGGHWSAKFGRWKMQLFRKANTEERRSYTV